MSTASKGSAPRARTVAAGSRLPVLDLRPLQEGHALRGIGRYVTTLAASLPFNEFVVWGDLPLPSDVGAQTVLRVPGSPRPGRLGWVRDSLQRRPSSGGACHVPIADARLGRPLPEVITAFDAIPWRFPLDYPAGRVGSYRRRGDAALARRVGRVLTCSEASADDLAFYLGVSEEAMRIVPLTAGAPWPEPLAGSGRYAPESLRNGRRYVVAAGGFAHADPRKRLGDLLDALRLLPEEVGLVLTGTLGPAADDFLVSARSKGVEGRVELTGQVSPANLVDLYAGAAAFAFPSAWEGFGLPLVEAMSVGLPCVVANGGALAEVAGDAATVVPVATPSTLAEALVELLDDAPRAAAASRRATARAAYYSVARFADAHLKAYGGS